MLLDICRCKWVAEHYDRHRFVDGYHVCMGSTPHSDILTKLTPCDQLCSADFIHHQYAVYGILSHTNPITGSGIANAYRSYWNDAFLEGFMVAVTHPLILGYFIGRCYGVSLQPQVTFRERMLRTTGPCTAVGPEAHHSVCWRCRHRDPYRSGLSVSEASTRWRMWTFAEKIDEAQGLHGINIHCIPRRHH